MPVTVQPVFGGFDYEASGATVEEWTGDPAFRGAVTPVPRSDVSRAQDGNLGPRRITARGIIGPDGGGTRDQLREIEDAFNWAHRPGYRQLFRDSDRFLTAEVRRLTLGADEGFSWMPFSVEWEAADPFWYATAADTDTWSTPADGNTRDLDNDGSATARPSFTVTVGSDGDLTLTLTNSTTGQAFTVTALPVTSGQALVIDCAAQTVKLAGTNRLSYFSGKFFALDPGTNTLTLALSGVTLSSIGSSWTTRWL
jgi:phage-related protein